MNTEVKPKTEEQGNLVSRLKTNIVEGLEDVFESYGRLVAQYPVRVIVICVLVTGLCGLGLLRFRAENEGIKLWIPRNSDFRRNNDWLFQNFPRGLRFNTLILTADNILVPEVLQAMLMIRKNVIVIRNEYNDTWEGMCYRRPVVKPPSLTDIFGRKKRQADDWDDDWENNDFFDSLSPEGDIGTDLSVVLYPEPYCSMVQKMPTACFESSLLELWARDGKYDEQTEEDIMNLTQEELLWKINNVNISGAFLVETNFTKYLGGIKYDGGGKIVGATATIMSWFGNMNMTAAKLAGPVEGRGEPVDPRMLSFEGSFIEVLLNTSFYPPGLESAPNVARSFGDIAGSTILGDIGFFGAGYVLMFCYASVMMGRVNCLEHRTMLAVAGIVGVVMGIVVSYGLCSGVGLFYGPMHSVMPFLMLGIGIDDMFVIVQSWETLSSDQKKESLVSRFGKTMRQAGVAISVTSITDVIAFGVGGFTILPALQSFCIYASVGIVATFVFQSTFFVAWFSLDQRRLEDSRNAFCCCVVHHEHEPNKLSQKNIVQGVFLKLGTLLTFPVVKVIVLLSGGILFGVGVWGNVLLRQEFDPAWFLPPGTYLATWFSYNKAFFPSNGEAGTIYFSNTVLPKEFEKIEDLVFDLESKPKIIQDVDSWTTEYKTYIYNNKMVDPGISIASLNESTFRKTLTQFLFSPPGALYRDTFQFKSDLECGSEAPDILLFKLTYNHKLFSGPEEQIPAMNAVKDAIAVSNVSGRVFPYAYGYAAWETDEVIAEEVYRNIAVAVVCVFFTILIFICNLRAAIIIICCVILTLVNVGGFMHFWGLTIDTVSCNNLIIAIGLCVDYSAHMTHRFLVEPGNKDQRIVATMQNIGPAVFNGGFSTFLAFILLAGSKSHVFISFFKIFFLVVTFGLFHGLIFLPVVLSLIGPVEQVQSVASQSL